MYLANLWEALNSKVHQRLPEHTLRSIDFRTAENQIFPNLTFIIFNEKSLYSPSLLFLEASVCLSRQYYTCAKNIIIPDSVFQSTWIAIIKWFHQKKQYVPLSSRFFCIMNGHFYITINNLFFFQFIFFAFNINFWKSILKSIRFSPLIEA